MNDKFDLQDIADFTRSLLEYRNLGSYLPQLDPKNEKLQAFCTKDGTQPTWHKSLILKDWERIDVHIVFQMWGSTSCGWGGMGGSAMTTKANIVIHNKWHGAYYVYWDGKLAYIMKDDESIQMSNLPALQDKSDFFIYKRSR